MIALTVVVYGTPAPQGSKLRTRYALIDDNAKTLHPWRNNITAATRHATHGQQPLTGPLAAHIAITLPKPKSAPKRRRTWPIARGNGDLDKYVRGVFDALTAGGAWDDDRLVVELTAIKTYPGEHPDALDRPGATITISPLETRP